METEYYSTQEEVMQEALKASDKNDKASLSMGKCRCSCGESFAVYLFDDETLENIKAFVDCHPCKIDNQ